MASSFETLLGGFSLAGLLLPASLIGQPVFPADAELQPRLDAAVESGATPGIVLGLLEADGSTRILAAGTGGPDGRPLDGRSVFELGSVTKTFTGVLLADMVLRGEVSLDDPIARYLPAGVPAPSADGREITLLDLATHRSGLPRLPDNHVPATLADPYGDFTVEVLHRFLAGHVLRRAPGAESEYSNVGFGLLGHLLAEAAGRSFQALLDERILHPLGMASTGFHPRGEMAGRMTVGHSVQGREVSSWGWTEAIEGAGGLLGSAEDLLRYLRAHLGDAEPGLAAAARKAAAPHGPPDGSLGIGLGWHRLARGAREIILHDGRTGGYTTLIAFDPERGAGVVLLTNVNGFTGQGLGLDLLLSPGPT